MSANDSQRSRIVRRVKAQYREVVEESETRFVAELAPTTENGKTVRHCVPFALTVCDNTARENVRFNDKRAACRELHVVAPDGLVKLGDVTRLALSEKERSYVKGMRLSPKVVRLARLVARKLVDYSFPGESENVTLSAWNGEIETEPFVLSNDEKLARATDRLVAALNF